MFWSLAAVLLLPALTWAASFTVTFPDELVSVMREEYAVQGVPADDARLTLLIEGRVTEWWTQLAEARLDRDTAALQALLLQVAPARRAQVRQEVLQLQDQMRALVRREDQRARGGPAPSPASPAPQ